MTDSHDSASPDLSPDPAPDEATSAATTDRRSSRTRAVIAGFVGVVAIIGLFATTVTVWAKGVLFDSDKVAAIVDDAMQEPEVNAAMATYLTDQLFVIVDVSGRVDAVLPAPLTALEPAIVGGAHSFVETRLQTLLAKDEVRQVITRVVRTAHAAMMKLLEGDGFGRAVTVTDGEVTINLLPLISRGLLAVQGLGLFDNVEIPTLTPDGDPAEQITELESAFGRDLPDDFAQLVVFQSQALADAGQTVNSAQQVMANVKRASWLIVGLTVVLLVATIVIAQRRRRAIVILALAGVAVMLLARMLVQRVVEKAPTLVIDPGARAAVACGGDTIVDRAHTAHDRGGGDRIDHGADRLCDRAQRTCRFAAPPSRSLQHHVPRICCGSSRRCRRGRVRRRGAGPLPPGHQSGLAAGRAGLRRPRGLGALGYPAGTSRGVTGRRRR